MTLDPFTPPPPLPPSARRTGVDAWQAGTEPAVADRWRQDLPRAVVVLVGSILLGAPTGLLWSRFAPRLSVVVKDSGLDYPDLEGSKAFIGADGSFLVAVLLAGVVCGVLAWVFARRSGPWTVLALAIGGGLAALVAARVGLQPGSQHAIAALAPGSSFRGKVDLYLGVRHHGQLHLRAPWTAVGWPVGALVAFLVPAGYRPHELD